MALGCLVRLRLGPCGAASQWTTAPIYRATRSCCTISSRIAGSSPSSLPGGRHSSTVSRSRKPVTPLEHTSGTRSRRARTFRITPSTECGPTPTSSPRASSPPMIRLPATVPMDWSAPRCSQVTRLPVWSSSCSPQAPRHTCPATACCRQTWTARACHRPAARTTSWERWTMEPAAAHRSTASTSSSSPCTGGLTQPRHLPYRRSSQSPNSTRSSHATREAEIASRSRAPRTRLTSSPTGSDRHSG